MALTLTVDEYQDALLEFANAMTKSMLKVAIDEIKAMLVLENTQDGHGQVFHIDFDQIDAWTKISYSEKQVLGKVVAAKIRAVFGEEMHEFKHMGDAYFTVTWKDWGHNNATASASGARPMPSDKPEKKSKEPAKKRARVSVSKH